MKPRFKTYAENMRVAAAEKGFFVREVAERADYGHEHVRRIFKGEQLNVSQDCNDALCYVLDLDPVAMFEMLENEKYAAKHGYKPPQLVDPLGRELMEVWEDLTQEQKQLGVRMLRGLSMERMAAAS